MKKRMNRRDFLKTASLVSGAGILAACAPTAAPAPAEEKPKAPAAQESVTINFTGWGGTEEDQGVKDAIKFFQEQTPNIKVTWIQIPENYQEKTMSMVAAGTPPDTAFIGSGDFQQYAKDGLLMDITNQLKADPELGKPDYFIEPQESERCTRDGKWFGIGSCWVAPHIYYNADIFEQEGIEPPSNDPAKAWTWDKLVEVGRQLTKDTNGKHPGESGFDKDNMDRWAIQWPTWQLPLHAAIASNGGQWLSKETGLLELDKPEAIEALQKVADLMLVESISPRGTAMEALGLTNTQMLENGKLAMAIDGSWALAWITKINAKLGTAVCPMFKTPATDMQAHLHSAFAKTKYPDAAWQWVRFLATEYYQIGFLKMGLWLPSQTALMTSEGMKKWYTERNGPGDGVHPAGYDMIVKEYVPKYGHVAYMPPGNAEAASVINPALEAIWVGDMTAEEAMKGAVPEANKILEAAK